MLKANRAQRRRYAIAPDSLVGLNNWRAVIGWKLPQLPRCLMGDRLAEVLHGFFHRFQQHRLNARRKLAVLPFVNGDDQVGRAAAVNPRHIFGNRV